MILKSGPSEFPVKFTASSKQIIGESYLLLETLEIDLDIWDKNDMGRRDQNSIMSRSDGGIEV
jgi:hypothetical protein